MNSREALANSCASLVLSGMSRAATPATLRVVSLLVKLAIPCKAALDILRAAFDILLPVLITSDSAAFSFAASAVGADRIPNRVSMGLLMTAVSTAVITVA